MRVNVCMCACRQMQTDYQINMFQTKVLEDLLQIVSFAHYVNVSEKILKGKYTNMKKNHRKLFNKLTRIACKLRQALSKSPLDYIIRDDVPTDLRHMKKDPWNDVVLYLVYERLEEYLKRLPGTYKRLRKIKN